MADVIQFARRYRRRAVRTLFVDPFFFWFSVQMIFMAAVFGVGSRKEGE